MAYRVLIVDDQKMQRIALETSLSENPDYQIVDSIGNEKLIFIYLALPLNHVGGLMNGFSFLSQRPVTIGIQRIPVGILLPPAKIILYLFDRRKRHHPAVKDAGPPEL